MAHGVFWCVFVFINPTEVELHLVIDCEYKVRRSTFLIKIFKIVGEALV